MINKMNLVGLFKKYVFGWQFFPSTQVHAFLFLSPLCLPQGLLFLLSAIILCNKVASPTLQTLKSSFHSPLLHTPALQAMFFLAFSTTIITLLSPLWVLFIYHSLSLPEFKISKQWRPGLSAV